VKKIIFCGGGSAGHAVPNVAICGELLKKYEILYLGTRGIEQDICKSAKIPFISFEAVKLTRGKIFKNFGVARGLIKSIEECKKILSDEKPDLIFCKGGYVSLPPAIAANKLGIPVLTHESDISAGLANKIIARRAERILTSFPETAKKFKNGVYTGCPMRKSLFGRDKLKAKRALGLDLREAVLVFGGGGGSKKINEALREDLLDLCRDYNVLHVCGKGNMAESRIYGYVQREYCDDMGELYAAADYAVARCGANSAFELISLKIPTLFIPLENRATRGDQVKNAEYFKSLGLCRVLREKDLSGDTLHLNIKELIRDAKLKTALRNANVERGNDNIIYEIENALIRN